MFKYAFYMNSIFTVYLSCLHIHIVICEQPKNQNWPSNNEPIKIFLKRNASEGVNNRKDVTNWSYSGRQREKAQIEYINEDSRELPLEENVKPYFRIQPDLENKEKSDINVSLSTLKRRNETHQSHAREGYEAREGLAHSRESYLRSSINKTSENHFKINAKLKNYQGLSIDDKALRAHNKNETGAYQSANSFWGHDQASVSNIHESKHTRGPDKKYINEKHKNNIDVYSSVGIKKSDLKNMAPSGEKFERDFYKFTSETDKARDKSMMMGKQSDRTTKSYLRGGENVEKYGNLDLGVKQYELQKGIGVFRNDVRKKISRISTKRQKYRPGTNMQPLRPDRNYVTKRYDKSVELTEERDRSREEGRNRILEGHFQIQEERDPGQQEHSHGSGPERSQKGRGDRLEAHGRSQEVRDRSREKQRDRSLKNQRDQNREIHRDRGQEGRGRGSYKERIKEGRVDIRMTEGYDALNEDPKTVKYIKEGRVDIRMTEGYDAFNEDPKTVKYDQNRYSKSYESIQINSAEDVSESREELKNIARTLPTSKTYHPKLQDNKSPLRTDPDCDTAPLAPYSVGRQLKAMKKYLDEIADIQEEVIGRTIEYNEIVLWKIKEVPSFSARYNFRANNKKKYADEPPDKKIVFIVHGLSVMGWHDLPCLSRVNRFKTLLDYYLENLDCFDIYLIPMANPDGVAKVATANWWNKNVSPQNACPGVHLDRNFDVGYNGTRNIGQTMSSCKQSYPGPKPFSEHESRAVRDVFFKYGHKIVAYFHVHAGTYDSGVFKGDAVLYPKGFTDLQSDDDKYIDLKADIEEAMRNTSFKVISMTVDTLHSWYGKVKGTSVDYASAIYGIPYAMELVMQIYEDNPKVADEDKREKHLALTELWQIVLDVLFDSIYRHAVKPNEI